MFSPFITELIVPRDLVMNREQLLGGVAIQWLGAIGALPFSYFAWRLVVGPMLPSSIFRFLAICNVFLGVGLLLGRFLPYERDTDIAYDLAMFLGGVGAVLAWHAMFAQVRSFDGQPREAALRKERVVSRDLPRLKRVFPTISACANSLGIAGGLLAIGCHTCVVLIGAVGGFALGYAAGVGLVRATLHYDQWLKGKIGSQEEQGPDQQQPLAPN